MKISPEATEAERALLGGLLFAPEHLARILEKVKPDEFYRPEHGALLRVLVRMTGEGIGIDLVTVADWIYRRGLLGQCGGAAYVAELPEHTPSTANLDHYADIIHRAHQLREVSRIGVDLANVEVSADLGEVAARTCAELHTVVNGNSIHPTGIREIVGEYLRDTDVERRRATPPGLSTGLGALDEVLDGGPRPGDLVIIAGRPAMGKSAIALNITDHVAGTLGRGVGWISMEMPRKDLVQRLAAQLADIDSRRLRDPRKLTDDEYERLRMVVSDIGEWPLRINDRPGLTIDQIRLQALQWNVEIAGGLSALVIDYLQIARATYQNAKPIDTASEISKGSKQLAKELGIPIYLLSQVNRKCEERKDDRGGHRPTPSDLRDSGQIEQDADIIAFVYREIVYNPSAPRHGAEVIISKYRNGQTGTAYLGYDAVVTKFRDLVPDDASV